MALTVIARALIWGLAAILATTSNGAANKLGSNIAGRDPVSRQTCLTPYDFGAVGDGVTDDYLPLKKWTASTTSTKTRNSPCLSFGNVGHFRSSESLTITMPASSQGPLVSGSCGYNTAIYFDDNRGLTLNSPTQMFYGALRCFAVTGNIAGPLVTLATGPADAMNGFIIDQLVVNNLSKDPRNIAIQFNGIYQSQIFATANCSGRTNGEAFKIMAATMNTFKLAGGHCSIGLHLTSGGDDVSGNHFSAVDFEINATGIKIDHPSVRSNIFTGGIISFHDSDDIGIDATAGLGNKFDSLTYGGAGRLFANTAGIVWVNALQDFAAPGPKLPSSRVPAVNSSAQPVIVNIYGGTVTSVAVSGVQVCDAVPCTVFLAPNDDVAVTYSAAPQWRWRALQF